MKISPERLAQLSRMEEARRQTQRQLDMIDRQIIRRMTALIPQLGRKRSGYRRGKPPDPSAFLERYRWNLAAITAARQPEIDALSRKLARRDTAIEMLRARCAPEVSDTLVTTRSAHIARTNVAVRPSVVQGSGMALRHSGPRRCILRGIPGHTLRAQSGGGQIEPFRYRQPGPYSVASPLGFAAVCAPGGPLQGQVASDRRPPISARPGRVRRRAQQPGTPLVRNRTLLAWRCPDLEAALIPAALGDRTRGESRQGPDRTRRRNQKRSSP